MSTTNAIPQTLAEVALLVVRERGDFDLLLSEFLDAFYQSPAQRQAMIDKAPGTVGRFEDAWLGAVAEHLARRWQLRIPDWVNQPGRFLDRPFFAGGLESLKAILLAESPLAFRKRQIFVEAEPLRRAQMPGDAASR